MHKHLERGQRGEQIAFDFLQREGWTILERNWRFSRAEVDLIAKEGDVLVFVEVKTRHSDVHGAPELAVNEKKEALLLDAAQVYMAQIGHEWEIRFDIISVILHPKVQIQHFKDAFFPSW